MRSASRADGGRTRAPSSSRGWSSEDEGRLSYSIESSQPAASSDQDFRNRYIDLPLLADGVAQLRSLATSIEHKYSADLRYPLSARAEWSRLASRDLQLVAPDNNLAHVAHLTHAQLRQQVQQCHARDASDLSEPVLLSFDHAQARRDEFHYRWPLEASQVPLPLWTLADEIGAIISKRSSQLAASQKQADCRPPSRKRRREGSHSASGGVNLETSSSGNDGQRRPHERNQEEIQPVIEDDIAENLIESVLLAVQHQLRRAYESMMLQETVACGRTRSRRGRPRRTELEGSRQDGQLPDPSIPTPRSGRRTRPLDWRNVIGILAQRSESASSRSELDPAFDQALQASLARLETIYGTGTLSLGMGRPRKFHDYEKSGNVADRLKLLEASRLQANLSMRSGRSPHGSQVLESIRTSAASCNSDRSQAELSILDPTELLPDYGAVDKLRPCPHEQSRETWPMPDPDVDSADRAWQPRFSRASSQQLTSSVGPISLPKTPRWPARPTAPETIDLTQPSRSATSDSDSGSSSGHPTSEESRSSSPAESLDDNSEIYTPLLLPASLPMQRHDTGTEALGGDASSQQGMSKRSGMIATRRGDGAVSSDLRSSGNEPASSGVRRPVAGESVGSAVRSKRGSARSIRKGAPSKVKASSGF